MPEKTCGCEPGDISTETVAKTIETQIANLDPQRADAFAGLQGARAARATGYAREQKRLAFKYGGDSSRVAEVAQKTQFNEGLRRDLNFEAARAGTETPTVGKDGYVFYGFVCDLKGQGIPRLTVALYDREGKVIREFGYGCTDDSGRFLLRYEPRQTKKGPVVSEFVAPAGTARALAEGSGAFIYMLNARKETLDVQKEPLHPQLGTVDFRLIVLGSQPGPCQPPPKTRPTDTGSAGKPEELETNPAVKTKKKGSTKSAKPSEE